MGFTRYARILARQGKVLDLLGRDSLELALIMLAVLFAVIFYIGSGSVATATIARVMSALTVVGISIANRAAFKRMYSPEAIDYLRYLGFSTGDFILLSLLVSLIPSLCAAVLCTVMLYSSGLIANALTALCLFFFVCEGVSGILCWTFPKHRSSCAASSVHHSAKCPNKRFAALVFKTLKGVHPVSLCVIVAFSFAFGLFLLFMDVPVFLALWLLIIVAAAPLTTEICRAEENRNDRFFRNYYRVTMVESAFAKTIISLPPLIVIAMLLLIVSMGWSVQAALLLCLCVLVAGVAQFSIAALVYLARGRFGMGPLVQFGYALMACVPLLPPAALAAMVLKRRPHDRDR